MGPVRDVHRQTKEQPTAANLNQGTKGHNHHADGLATSPSSTSIAHAFYLSSLRRRLALRSE